MSDRLTSASAFFDYRIDIFVLIAKVRGMTGVGCHAFAAVDSELFEGADVGVFFGENTCERFSLFIFVGLGLKLDFRETGERDFLLFRLSAKDVFKLERLCDVVVKHRIVEVCVCDCGEECIDNEV